MDWVTADTRRPCTKSTGPIGARSQKACFGSSSRTVSTHRRGSTRGCCATPGSRAAAAGRDTSHCSSAPCWARLAEGDGNAAAAAACGQGGWPASSWEVSASYGRSRGAEAPAVARSRVLAAAGSACAWRYHRVAPPRVRWRRRARQRVGVWPGVRSCGPNASRDAQGAQCLSKMFRNTVSSSCPSCLRVRSRPTNLDRSWPIVTKSEVAPGMASNRPSEPTVARIRLC